MGQKAKIDSGQRAGVPIDVAEKPKAVKRENRELRQAKEILRRASVHSVTAKLHRREAALCPGSRQPPAAGPRARLMSPSCSTHSSSPCTIDGRSISAGLCTRATDVANTSGSKKPSAWLRPVSSFCRSVGIPTTMPRRNHRRPLQGRGDPLARTMAQLRGYGMGGLVQQPEVLGAYRQHPASRGRATLPPHAGAIRHGVNLNQTASGNPGTVQSAPILIEKRTQHSPSCSML